MNQTWPSLPLPIFLISWIWCVSMRKEGKKAGGRERRKEGRKVGEGRKAKEGRKEGEGRKVGEGRKEGR